MPSKYIRIKVEQDDIDRAIQSNSAKCVVAQALARTLPDASRISVDSQTVRFTDGRGIRRVYLCPAKVEAYVINFDAGDSIHPFEFSLYDSQRVNTPTRPTTEAGQARKKARSKKVYAERKLATLQANPDASPVQVAAAVERVEQAVDTLERVKDETAGQSPGLLVHPPAEDGIIARKSPARKPRTPTGSNVREYGHRRMRINNDTGPRDFRGPLDTDPTDD